MLIEPWYLYLALLAVFFLSAMLHSSVGLGGGSSYTAWMVILSVPTLMIPSLALSLTILVSGIVSIQFIRKRLMPWKILILLLAFSAPSAYMGGSLRVNENIIHLILLISLIFIAFRLVFFDSKNYKQTEPPQRLAIIYIAILGALLGFLAGLVGIGGGIYLVPALLILHLAGINQAAACGGAFILCNSIVGLFAKWQANNILYTFEDLLPSLLAVALGGILGSQFSITQKNETILQKILIFVVLLACLLLIKKILIGA